MLTTACCSSVEQILVAEVGSNPGDEQTDDVSSEDNIGVKFSADALRSTPVVDDFRPLRE